jgi:polysaccharide deacetylase 2 family uncharacterized protein YibQ
MNESKETVKESSSLVNNYMGCQIKSELTIMQSKASLSF